MNKYIELFKKIFLSNRAKTFYWTTLNGLIALLIIYVAELHIVSGVFIIGILNLITKFINVTYLKGENDGG